MGKPEPDNQRIKKLVSLDKVIHEPGRLAIMSYLMTVEEADFLFLLDQTGLTRGNLSSHMTRLEKAGFVTVAKVFIEKMPRTTYTITATGKKAFQKYRAGLLNSLGS